MLIENDVTASIRTLDEKDLILKEIEGYLCEKTNPNITDGLKDFPVIRDVFIKYNCIRSSEAICERMFSYAGKFIKLFAVLCDPSVLQKLCFV